MGCRRNTGSRAGATRRRDIFIAISRFTIANDTADAVEQAFLRRPHKVEAAEGFLRLEVMRGGADRRDFWLLTWWADQESFEQWHHSPEHKASHALIPRGLKLVKHSFELHRLDFVCS